MGLLCKVEMKPDLRLGSPYPNAFMASWLLVQLSSFNRGRTTYACFWLDSLRSLSIAFCARVSPFGHLT